MDIYKELALKIIKAQEDIVGSVALDLAKKVPGIAFDASQNITITGDQKDVINQLIKQYENLFGLASIDACKRATRKITLTLPKDQLPPLLA